MGTQMIIRIDPGLKEKADKLAKKEGKTLSGLVRELLENYTKERDVSAYIDNLWDRIEQDLKSKSVSQADVEKVIEQVRSSNE